MVFSSEIAVQLQCNFPEILKINAPGAAWGTQSHPTKIILNIRDN